MSNVSKNFDISIEKLVLGILIMEPKVITKYISKLSLRLFYDKTNQVIFQIIEKKFRKNEPFDMVILILELDKIGKRNLDLYITEITTKAFSSAHLEHYIMILVELSIKRDFIHKFSQLIKIAEDPEEDVFSVRDKAFDSFENLFIDEFIKENQEQNAFPQLIQMVEDKSIKIASGEISGLQSSLNIINKAVGGWQKSDLTIIAGRPGMGKTAFMIQQIVDMVQQGLSCAVFSLEMSAEQIAGRVVNNYTQIPNYAILRKGMSSEEWSTFNHYKKTLQSLRIHIDDTPAISISSLRLKAKMFQLKYGIDIIFIDYLQLMSGDGKASNREQEISMISRSLKAIAKELNIPVIALSQLSRKVEERSDKRPMLSDLRDSGSIEQDADEVIFLFRPEYYGIEYWGNEYNSEKTDNQVEIIIQKNRQGGLLAERYAVNLPTSRFLEF